MNIFIDNIFTDTSTMKFWNEIKRARIQYRVTAKYQISLPSNNISIPPFSFSPSFLFITLNQRITLSTPWLFYLYPTYSDSSIAREISRFADQTQSSRSIEKEKHHPREPTPRAIIRSSLLKIRLSGYLLVQRNETVKIKTKTKKIKKEKGKNEKKSIFFSKEDRFDPYVMFK